MCKFCSFLKENIGLRKLAMMEKFFVYDSLFTAGSLTPSTEEQLVRLYRPAVRNNCQQQEEGVDCGLFTKQQPTTEL